MHISYSEIFNAFIVLFAVINALGNIPIFINLQKEGKIIYPMKAALMSLFILISFFYIGDTFLSLLGVTVSSFAVAGSFVIFLIGLGMILDMNFFKSKESVSQDTTFMPVVFPLLIGAGTFTTLISLRAQYQSINILIACLLNAIIIFGILKGLKKINKIIGPSFLYTLQKFFGLILVSMAVKIFTTNIVLMINEINANLK
jgi:multiple antibiotic resistance protein